MSEQERREAATQALRDIQRQEDEKRAYRGPCADPRHGHAHHWCSELGGFTGGLKRRGI